MRAPFDPIDPSASALQLRKEARRCLVSAAVKHGAAQIVWMGQRRGGRGDAQRKLFRLNAHEAALRERAAQLLAEAAKRGH